jgi:tRNA(Ile)-lysidine synthase
VAVHPAGRGLEDAARQARHAAFAEARREDECLVLAHHRGDQAETLLLALLRGSGERGLAAMRPFTRDARGPVWRPLLATPPDEVQAYAEAHGLRWVEDPANADLRFDRNRLRHTVLPLLQRHWPGAEAALAHSAAHLAEADALLQRQALVDLAPLLGLEGRSLALDGLHALPPERARRSLRRWMEEAGVRATRDALERVLGPWREQPPGRALRHALGSHWLRQWGGRLWLTPRGIGPPPQAPAHWDGRASLALPDGGELALLGAAALPQPLRLAFRGDAPARVLLAGASRPRRLSDCLAGFGIPPWQRETVPLLVDARGEIVAIGDLAYAPAFDDWLRRHRARLAWRPGEAGG